MRGAAIAAAFVLCASGARAQDISDAGLFLWGVKFERLEYRHGDEDEKILAYEGDAFVGTDRPSSTPKPDCASTTRKVLIGSTASWVSTVLRRNGSRSIWTCSSVRRAMSQVDLKPNTKG